MGILTTGDQTGTVWPAKTYNKLFYSAVWILVWRRTNMYEWPVWSNLLPLQQQIKPSFVFQSRQELLEVHIRMQLIVPRGMTGGGRFSGPLSAGCLEHGVSQRSVVKHHASAAILIMQQHHYVSHWCDEVFPTCLLLIVLQRFKL